MMPATANSDDTPPKRAKVSDLYEIRRGDLDADADDILRLWRYLPGDNPPQREKLEWFYRDNPAGRGIVYLLDYKPDARAVGVVCLGPREFTIEGRPATGAVFGDFAVEPEHRSLGPALMFQKDFLRLARQEFDFIFGFPNASSGKVRSFGGHRIDYQLDIAVLPLDFRQYLGRRLPSALAGIGGTLLNGITRAHYGLRQRFAGGGYRDAEYTDTFMDTLWARVATQPLQQGKRDAEFVAWRLAGSPQFDYQLIALEDRHGEPAAFAALRRSAADGALSVDDFLAVSDEAFRALLASLSRRFAGRARSIGFRHPHQNVATRESLARFHFRVRDQFDAFVTLGESPVAGADLEALHLSFADNDV